MAERLFETRNSQSLSYKIGEDALRELQEFNDRYRQYIPDAFADEFLPFRFRPLPEAPEIEIPPDPVSEEDHKALLAQAIEKLESGEVYQQATIEDELAQKAFGGRPDFFGGASMDLSEEASMVVEAIQDARSVGHGNLDVAQTAQFFNHDERWRHSGPDEEL